MANCDQNIARYFTLVGTVISIPTMDEKIYYMGCPSENCSKKVIEDYQGYRCENCCKTYDKFEPTYMMNVSIQDSTGRIFVNFSKHTAENLLGVSAAKFLEMRKSSSEEEMEEFFAKQQYRKVTMVVKARHDSYNGETRTKFHAVRIMQNNAELEI
jgi:replication factor A1